MSNSPLELVLKESYLKVKRPSGFIVDFLKDLKLIDVMNVVEQSMSGVRTIQHSREKKTVTKCAMNQKGNLNYTSWQKQCFYLR